MVRSRLGVRAAAPAAALVAAVLLAAPPLSAQYISTQELLTRPKREPDHVIAYGDGPRHFGHLRLPAGPGPHRVLIVIHGGCWLGFADLRHLDEFSEDLTDAGWATWSIEYRPIDEAGGGWPGTFLDVADGIDHLRGIADEYHLDLGHIAVIGHSAGGHLALWAAGRRAIPEGSELYRPDPLMPAAVVSLGGLGDLEDFHRQKVPTCGPDIIPRLMGSEPEDAPGRYTQGSPARLLPFGIPQLQITGRDDRSVPARFAEAFGERARAAGDEAQVMILDHAAHFEVVAPWSRVWPVVRRSILAFLEETVP